MDKIKPIVFLKAHVDQYTRSDGTVVQAHDTKVQAALPDVKTGNVGNGFHGAAMDSHRRETHGVDGDSGSEADSIARHKAADHAFSRVANKLVADGHFSNHAHAREFLDSTHGRHLGDEIGHKGDPASVKWLPKSVKEFKAQAGIKDAPAAPAPVKHADLKEGDILKDEHGNTHEFSHLERGLGRFQAVMRSGYKYPTKGADLPGFSHTGKNHLEPAKPAAPVKNDPVHSKPRAKVPMKASEMARARELGETTRAITGSQRVSALSLHDIDTRAGTAKYRHTDGVVHDAVKVGANWHLTGDHDGGDEARSKAAPAAPAADYAKPAHVKTKADEIDHLSKIAPEKRTPGEKARLKKIISQGGLGKHSPEYQAHLKSADAEKPALDPHPNVIGKAENVQDRQFDFDGKTYHKTGKEGHSMHDQTAVSEYEHPESGHRVWKDESGRVHADSHDEAYKYRKGK